VKILLDTCTFLWIATGAPRLSQRAKDLFADPDNDPFLSAVSSWEIAIKHSQGRLPLPEPPEEFLPTCRRLFGIASLPLREEAALYLGRLPRHHNDPFDRMLICQSIVYGLPILSPDPLLAQYPARLLW
jgi:PIN domain nuclease of toxin-antitoxin system